MLWGRSVFPTDGITYARQDQDWIQPLTQNSRSTGLRVKVGKTFDKLEGHQQASVTCLWIVLDTISNITLDIAKGLK